MRKIDIRYHRDRIGIYQRLRLYPDRTILSRPRPGSCLGITRQANNHHSNKSHIHSVARR